MSAKDLEKQLKKWREDRARKTPQQIAADRRTVRVNGQDVLVIGTHFAKPTAGHVIRDGDAYRFAVT